eukprot:Gb_19517 [translate_table: standard]
MEANSFSLSYPLNTEVCPHEKIVWNIADSSLKQPCEAEAEVEVDLHDVVQESIWEELDLIGYPLDHRNHDLLRINSPMEPVKLKYSKEKLQFAEQGRRKRMKDLFTTLKSVLPSAHLRLDKCSLLEETYNYIGRLQDDLQQLKRRRDQLQATHTVSRISSVEETLTDQHCGDSEKDCWVLNSNNPNVLSKSLGKRLPSGWAVTGLWQPFGERSPGDGLQGIKYLLKGKWKSLIYVTTSQRMRRSVFDVRMSSFISFVQNNKASTARLAQLVERKALNLVVATDSQSSTAVDDSIKNGIIYSRR